MTQKNCLLCPFSQHFVGYKFHCFLFSQLFSPFVFVGLWNSNKGKWSILKTGKYDLTPQKWAWGSRSGNSTRDGLFPSELQTAACFLSGPWLQSECWAAWFGTCLCQAWHWPRWAGGLLCATAALAPKFSWITPKAVFGKQGTGFGPLPAAREQSGTYLAMPAQGNIPRTKCRCIVVLSRNCLILGPDIKLTHLRQVDSG